MNVETTVPKRKVREIPAKPEFSGRNTLDLRPKRVAAYCRVSTDREEQEHSFETQKQMYTDMIMMKPNWQMAGIYADEGINQADDIKGDQEGLEHLLGKALDSGIQHRWQNDQSDVGVDEPVAAEIHILQFACCD